MKIKNRIFVFLVNVLYKSFNVIERGDKIISRCPIDRKNPKIFRIVDMYQGNTADVVCDKDPQPMRQKVMLYSYRLHDKFFRGEEFLRDPNKDNGWRLFGTSFLNYKTKEVL
jgi:uncharacterized protein (DUF2249 family)